MNKFTKIFGSIVLVSVLVIGGYLYKLWHSPVESVEAKTNGESTYELYTESLEETQFQQTLHEMTHQKIHAEAKWGATEITEEQIDTMLATMEKESYVHEEYYREVLTAWKNGDFSNAVEVHNKIWEIQGGTIGRAERLLTAEEEQEYIDRNFR